MIVELFAALAFTTSPAPTFSGEFAGYKERNEETSRWERFDLKLTNTSKEQQTLGVCSKDADMVLKTHQASMRSAFALKFDQDNWFFGCNTKEVAPGESTIVSMYFRPAFSYGPSRYIALKTNQGDFLLGS